MKLWFTVPAYNNFDSIGWEKTWSEKYLPYDELTIYSAEIVVLEQLDIIWIVVVK